MQWERWLRRKPQRCPRPPDRPLLAAGEVRRRPCRCRPAISVDPGDLVSSGVFGLIDAVERFDPERGVKFETFAVPRIRGAIFDGLRQLDWVPRSVRSRAREVETAISELEAKHGRAPTDDELAGAPPHRCDELQRWLASIASTTVGPLDRALVRGAEPAALDAATVPSRRRRSSRTARCAAHAAEISKLPDREKLVLSLYYDEGLTLAEIGQVLGVTESRVSQIHTKSVLHLRSRLSAAGVA